MTASRTLNTPLKVGTALRERVMRACAALDYIPHRAASSLASARSRLVVVLTPSWDDPAGAPLLAGLSRTLSAQGYAAILAHLDHDHEQAPGPAAAANRPGIDAATMRFYLSHAPDAIVFAGTRPDGALLAQLQNRDLPWTQACGAGPAAGRPGAGAPPRAVGACAIAHLLARGYRRIGVACARAEPGAAERAAGALAALAQAGQAGTRGIHCDGLPTPAAGARLMARLLEQPQTCDAVFFTHDMLAWGALNHCRERGVNVPGQIAIMGVHDLPASQWLAPSLTSVDTRRGKAGEQAARELIERVEGPARKARWFDPGCAVVTRESA